MRDGRLIWSSSSMAVSVSAATMIERLCDMLDSDDLTDEDVQFLVGVVERKNSGQVTTLTGKQVETLDRLHSKHFGD